MAGIRPSAHLTPIVEKNLGPIALLEPLSDILAELLWEFQQSPVTTFKGDVSQLRQKAGLSREQDALLPADDISLVPKEQRRNVHDLVVGVRLLALVPEDVAPVP